MMQATEGAEFEDIIDGKPKSIYFLWATKKALARLLIFRTKVLF